MNRPLIITIGIVIVLLVFGLWVYLLAYGAPEKPTDVFTNLGFITDVPETSVTVVPTPQDDATQLSIGGNELQQLTTRAIAGFTFASSSVVRYVEEGTGHVYEIDLNSNTEVQVSHTTVPQVASAIFSPGATAMALISYDNYTQKTIIGILTDTQELLLNDLPLNAENVAFMDDSTVYFTQETPSGTRGYSLEIHTQTQTELFDLDLKNIRVVWGEHVGKIYVHTLPTEHLEGYLYEVVNNSLQPVGRSAHGLTALIHEGNIVTSYVEKNTYVSSVYDPSGERLMPVLMTPEKCAFHVSSPLTYCAAPLEPAKASYLESWYKGTLVSHDYLWYTDLFGTQSALIADLSTLSGRTIDVSGITINNDGTLLLLLNKNDTSLWLYRLP